ncbi:hypothetical protein MAE02_30750 [Microvirga aerophila]|uniref:Uncharacterized protein n=1 Tax=Microvirga aerophila TaxID=670291 RepID=A0A512BTR7_9HYPH|nr:hypothetical protein MAE02_30750 [Microvirga aerophila]
MEFKKEFQCPGFDGNALMTARGECGCAALIKFGYREFSTVMLKQDIDATISWDPDQCLMNTDSHLTSNLRAGGQHHVTIEDLRVE